MATRFREFIKFSVPMIWNEQQDHVTDCYFCLTKVTGFSTKNKKKIEYANVESAKNQYFETNQSQLPYRLQITQQVDNLTTTQP